MEIRSERQRRRLKAPPRRVAAAVTLPYADDVYTIQYRPKHKRTICKADVFASVNSGGTAGFSSEKHSSRSSLYQQAA